MNNFELSKYFIALLIAFLAIEPARAYSQNALNTEIQFNLCELDLLTVAQKLGVSTSQQRERTTYFADTANYDFKNSGVIFRLRVETNSAQFTLKLRNVNADQFAKEFRNEQSWKCEIDQHVDYEYVTCSVNNRITLEDAERALNGKIPLLSLFSAAQRKALYYAGYNESHLHHLNFLEPIYQNIIEFKISGISDKMSLEHSQSASPDYKPSLSFERLQISARTPSQSAGQVTAKIVRLLNSHNLLGCKL